MYSDSMPGGSYDAVGLGVRSGRMDDPAGVREQGSWPSREHLDCLHWHVCLSCWPGGVHRVCDLYDCQRSILGILGFIWSCAVQGEPATKAVGSQSGGYSEHIWCSD